MEKPRFDIFLGGPMGEKGDDGAGMPFEQHFDNLKLAVKSIRDELNSEGGQPFAIAVDDPVVSEFGAIPDTVFNMLNFAELGIMDLTAESPSVMYELTFLHTLGTPVLPIIFKHQHDQNRIPFYLRQDYIAVVEDFKFETLKTKLKPLIKAALGPTIMGADRSTNPITKFYGIPMVEASATTGLATGYFSNFLGKVIVQNDSVFQKVEGLKSIVVLRPQSLDEVAPMQENFINSLEKLDMKLELIGGRDGKTYPDKASIRGQMMLFKVGDYIIDTPAPLNAQKSSHRFRRIRQLLRSQGGTDHDEIQGLIRKQENDMIDQFFSRLMYLADIADNVNPNRLMFATPDQMLDILQSEREAEAE